MVSAGVRLVLILTGLYVDGRGWQVRTSLCIEEHVERVRSEDGVRSELLAKDLLGA